MKECNACGKCCIKYGAQGLSLDQRDIALWEENAPELLDYTLDKELWFDPKTKQPVATCPWLQPQENGQYHCAIYYNRPLDCRYYPSTVEEMIRDECEMIEVKDLKNPKKAQQDLQIIMSDSWV